MKKHVSLGLLFAALCVCCKAEAAEHPRQTNAILSIAEQRKPSIPLAKSVAVEPVKEIPNLKSISSVNYFNQKVDGMPTSPRNSPNDSPVRFKKPVTLTASQERIVKTKTKEDK